MTSNIIYFVLTLFVFYSVYKIGYLVSEIKFIKMVKRMINQIDPHSPMAIYNIEFINMLKKEFEEDRE